MISLTQKIRQFAQGIGFDLVGFTPADPLPDDDQALQAWLLEGCAGEMAYMARDPARRANPKQILPEAKTVICLAMNYYPGDHPEQKESAGRISRYAWGMDYHQVIEQKLDQLQGYIQQVVNQPLKMKHYVDHGPILERAFASRAGLGFIGKNTMLITHEYGSWVFLAELIIDLELEDKTAIQYFPAFHCGSCTLCIDSCPTGAIVAPYKLDARRCISYLTIENKGDIPKELQFSMTDWIFGCDICQEVCPYNHQKPITHQSEFLKGTGPWLNPKEVMAMDEKAFKTQLQGTPLLRPKHRGLQRNAEVVATNNRVNIEERSNS
jgi:epoxyqueuosine reductase